MPHDADTELGDLLFSEALTRLFVAAGRPTLKSIADAVAARGRGAGVSVPRGLYVRLGEWRSGKHTPREFDAVVRLVLAELLDRARSRENPALDGVPARMDQWHTIWQRTWSGQSARAADSSAGGVSGSPYPGLASYTAADRDRFFGRGAAIGAITAHIDDAVAAGGAAVAVVGVSGAGKSSVLAAGVRPSLTERGFAVVAITPGATPMAALAEQLGTPAPPTADTVRADLRTWAQQQSLDRVAVVVDQAEDLFTAASEDERTEFIRLLSELATGARAAEDGSDTAAVVVVVGLRADFMAHWAAYPLLRKALNQHLFVLGPMTRSELAEAITGPLPASGVSMEDGLAEHFIDELCGRGNSDYEAGLLPLLNHALAATWRNRQGNRLTWTSYRAVGGVTDALTETAEQLWARLEPNERDVLRSIMIRLVYIGDGIRNTRRIRPRSEVLDGLGPAGDDVLAGLVDVRLVSVDDAGMVSVIHEIVLTGWDRLQSWILENRATLLTLQKVETAAREWDAAGRDHSHLYRGVQLESAQSARDRHNEPLPPVVVDFLVAGERTTRRTHRVRSIGIAALVCVTIAALISTVLAWRANEAADEGRASAQLGEIQAQSDGLHTEDPTLSARLALLAYRQDPSPENEARLYAAEASPLATAIPADAGALYDLAVSPDGLHVAAAGENQTIRTWSLDDGHTLTDAATLTGHTGFVTSVAWSPDGQNLASTSNDGTARIWRRDASGAWETTQTLVGHTGRVVWSAFAPDGLRLATSGMDSTVRVWDTRTGQQLAALTGHQGDVKSVAWSRDGRVIASGSGDQTARIWDGSTYAPLARLSGHNDTVHSVAFTPDGKTLVTGSDDSTVRLWDVSSPTTPYPLGQPLTHHTSPIWSATVSADGRRLLVASLDGTATVWDIAVPSSPTLLGKPLKGAASSLYSAAFTPDARTVLTGSADGRLRIWQLPSTILAGHSQRVVAPAIAGNRMVSAGFDGLVNLWDISDPADGRLLDGVHTAGPASVHEVSISPDGDVAAAATAAGTVELYRVGAAGTLTTTATIRVETIDQQHVSISPTGTTMAISADDNTFELWDITAPDRPVKAGSIPHGDNRSWATALTWSPDGSRMATGGQDQRLNLWDVTDIEHPRRLAISDDNNTGTVNAVAWSPVGDVIAAAGLNGNIRLWSVGADRFDELSPATPGGHSVRTLDFTADGQRLVAAGDAAAVSVWDTSAPDRPRIDGRPITLSDHSRWYARIDPAGTFIVTGGDGGALQMTILDSDYAVRRICTDSTPMSREQWAQNVPGQLPIRDLCR